MESCASVLPDIMGNFDENGPQWILDRNGSGPLVWRRNSNEKSRVKFRYDVEVKEFSRAAHEFEDAEWAKDLEYNALLPVFLTCVFCISITVLLPWYVIGSNV